MGLIRTFSRERICCLCLSSSVWHFFCNAPRSSSRRNTLSFSRDFSDSRSRMTASWVIWVACRLPIWPGRQRESRRQNCRGGSMLWMSSNAESRQSQRSFPAANSVNLNATNKPPCSTVCLLFTRFNVSMPMLIIE